MSPREVGGAGERGFTLIELLVGLAIFALLSAAAVAVLSGMVSAQGSIKRRFDDTAAIQRTAGALAGDLGQAVPRVTRLQNGLLAPAFFARPDGDRAPLMEFVRAGWSNIDAQPRPTLQKVEYWLRGNRLERQSHAQLDGTAADPATPLLEGIERVALRFRDDEGRWSEAWTPLRPEAMPRAVELTLARTGQAPLILRFLVAPVRSVAPLVPPPGEPDPRSPTLDQPVAAGAGHD